MTSHLFDAGRSPEWTMGDRLRKARASAGFTVKQLAETTGISEKSINNYEADRYVPRRPSLVTWALATGVRLAWLETGEVETAPTPPDGGEALRKLTASKTRSRHRHDTPNGNTPRYARLSAAA